MRATILSLVAVAVTAVNGFAIFPVIIGEPLFVGNTSSISGPAFCGPPSKPTCAWNPYTLQVWESPASPESDAFEASLKKRQGNGCPQREPGGCGPVCVYTQNPDGSLGQICGCTTCGQR